MEPCVRRGDAIEVGEVGVYFNDPVWQNKQCCLHVSLAPQPMLNPFNRTSYDIEATPPFCEEGLRLHPTNDVVQHI